MQWVFYFDQSRCIGCNTCVVACKDWNSVQPGPASWMRLMVTEKGIFPNVSVYNLVVPCYHCKNPACIQACDSKAISKRREDGIVVVDRSKCSGSKKCLAACPFNAPQFADDHGEPFQQKDWRVKHPMQKCDFCLDRLKAGKNPACVDSCLTRALDAGPEDAIRRKYPSAVNSVVGLPDQVYRITVKNSKRSLNARPAIYFKQKPTPVSD